MWVCVFWIAKKEIEKLIISVLRRVFCYSLLLLKEFRILLVTVSLTIEYYDEILLLIVLYVT